MVRRKRQGEAEKLGLPRALADFAPSDWLGRSEYQRYSAWREARHSWAEANLSGGVADLPWWHGEIPDQPWDEVVL